MNVIELRFIFIIMFVTVANFNEHQSVYIQRKTVLNHGAFAEMCDVVHLMIECVCVLIRRTAAVSGSASQWFPVFLLV